MSTKLISMRSYLSAAGLALAISCLAAGQQRSTEGRTAEQAYKNLKVLNGIPADQVTPTMRIIARSLGVTCEFCHDPMDRSKDGIQVAPYQKKYFNANCIILGSSAPVTCPKLLLL